MASAGFNTLSNRIKNWNLPLIIQIWIFFLINLFFQLIWEYFEIEINDFQPFVTLSDAIGNILLTITPAVVNPLFKVELIRDGISLILPNGLYVNYFFYLSGIKQMCLVVVLFLIIHGPWAKKLWFIPVCLVIIQVTVFLRFITVNIHCLIQPEYAHFIQDILFGPLFYVEIVVMWLAWILILAKTASLKYTNPRNRRG